MWLARLAAAVTIAALVPAGLAARPSGQLRLGESGRPAPPAPAGARYPYLLFNRGYEWPLVRMLARTLWASTLGNGERIAVLDTGINLHQSDIAGAIHYIADLTPAPGRNGGSDESSNSHGTAIAGLIAARGSAFHDRMAGLAPRAWLLDIRVAIQAVAIRPNVAAAGIMLAVRHRARIINISLPVSGSSRDLGDAISYAAARNCLIVASAGTASAPQGLARYNDVLIVGAVDRSSRPLPGQPAIGKVTMLAPGADLYSIGEAGGRGGSVKGYVYKLIGSGYAAAYVSASIALLLAAAPKLTPGLAEASLRTTSRPVEGGTRRGLINPLSALRQIAGTRLTPSKSPSPKPTRIPVAVRGSGLPALKVSVLATLAVAAAFVTTVALRRRRRRRSPATSAPSYTSSSWDQSW